MAGTALSSLRVTSDFDATAYTRGAQQKVDADAKMIASDKARNAALAQADAALAKTVPGMASVSKSLLDGYGAGAQFEAIIRRIGNAVDRGMGLDRANQLLDAAYQKFGLTADAAVLAERGFVSITGAVTNLNKEYGQLAAAAASANAAMARTQTQSGINESFGIGVDPSKSAKESADAFLAQYGGLEGIAKTQAQQIGDAFAQELQTRLVSGTSKSAKASAAVFEEEMQRVESIARQQAQQAGAIYGQDLEASLIAGIAKSARDSAGVFEEEFRRIDTIAQQRAEQAGSNFQKSLTAALGGGGPSAVSQGATYSALTEQLQELDRVEQLRAQHSAAVTQQLIAEANGYDRVTQSARDSAQAFIENDRQTQALRGILEEAAQAQQDMATKANALRAAINPLDAEMVKLGKEMAGYRQLLNAGAISSVEFEQAQVLMAKRLGDVQQQLKNTGNTGRVASGELVNLGYQLNDIVTGLALGQSPFMIIAQQGGQVFQILQNSKAGITEFFTTIGSKALGFLTTARLVFGGVAGGVGLATAALMSYLSAQEKVNMGLLGAGRTSGVTAAGINNIADQGSSATGLSISEARELATALATTGKVANENILPIVQMGKDISRIYGIDAPEATKMLADSFSDPVRGADALNQRLGFLDAGMQRNIQNLVAQNNVYGAQKVLLAGVQQSLGGVSDAVGITTKGWTALGNAISNGWDVLGRFIASSLGLGSSLDEQLDKAKAKLNELKGNGGFNIIPGYEIPFKVNDAEIEKYQTLVDQLTAAIERNKNAAINAQAAQRSFLIDSTARSLQPEIADREKLNNDLRVMQQVLDEIGNSEAAGEVLKRLGLSMKQLTDVTAVAAEKVKAFKSDFVTSLESLQTANAAISAFSPSQKGAIAYQQSLQANQRANLDATQKQTLALQAQENAIKQVTVALSEAGRARELSANQSVASAKAEQETVGKTMAQQELIRANLQSRQQLEQEQSVNRTGFDNAQYQRLVKINEQYAKQKQLAAEAALNDNIKFGGQTALLTPEDAQIAQQLRFKYTDVQQALASVEAQGLRTNGALSQLSSTISGQLTTGFADIVDGTKSISQGFQDMSKLVIRAIEEMIVKIAIVQPLMQALQIGANSLGIGGAGGFGNIGSMLGSAGVTYGLPGTAGSNLYGPVAPSALGNIFRSGNIIPFARGGVVHGPTIFPMARGAGLMGEAGPEAVMPLRRGPDGRLGVSAPSGAANDNRYGGGVVVNIHNAPAGAETRTSQDSNGNTTVDVIFKKAMTSALIDDAQKNGPMSQAIAARQRGFAGG